MSTRYTVKGKECITKFNINNYKLIEDSLFNPIGEGIW